MTNEFTKDNDNGCTVDIESDHEGPNRFSEALKQTRLALDDLEAGTDAHEAGVQALQNLEVAQQLAEKGHSSEFKLGKETRIQIAEEIDQLTEVDIGPEQVTTPNENEDSENGGDA